MIKTLTMRVKILCKASDVTWGPPPPKRTQSAVCVVSMLTHEFRSTVRHLQLHQSFDVFNPRCFPVSVCGAKSLLHQVLLLPLDLHHALLHWIFHNELGDDDFPLLSQTVAAVDALLLSGRVPCRVHDENMRGGGQVKPHPSSFEWQKHDGGTLCCRALKLLDDLSPPLLAHGAIQTHKTETMLSEWSLQYGEEACKLRDDQTLNAAVFTS